MLLLPVSFFLFNVPFFEQIHGQVSAKLRNLQICIFPLTRSVCCQTKTWILEFFFVCLPTPPALSGAPGVWFSVRQTYSLSFFAFKRVTHRRAIKTQFPSPLLPQVATVGNSNSNFHQNIHLMVEQDWYRTVFQTEDPDPYPLQTEDRHRC